MDEQWGYIEAKSRQTWLFYAYDRICRAVVAERIINIPERLLSLLSTFDVGVRQIRSPLFFVSRTLNCVRETKNKAYIR